ncbi:uncharacterized protein M6B38_258880 [Iris pallida]|uniref:RWD domain-containing protein n=1 Tax=Iris pallida TaxID=29817 RepID=A0AAX6IEE9_IRIPA|nr:uncharacterized protein M6B38_258880 [Iris pallida]
MAEEEEIRMEVEAVQAVYGDDCLVIQHFPPHLSVHIKPRTADDSSQQFVEVTLGIKSSVEYPRTPPYVYILEMKGLDDNRQTHLIASINNKAQELTSCPMLVALCEEAVEILSNMNHPEGDCPLCLYSLVTQDGSGIYIPFMKLMSCYHCFHSECFLRWWKWLQEQNKSNDIQQTEDITTVSVGKGRGMHTSINQQKGNCPVCRKDFDAQDMEHVLDYMDTNSSTLIFAGKVIDEDDEKVVLQSDKESERREKFEALLKLQQENNGLIEPRKNLAIFPGMFLPETISAPTTSAETIGIPTTSAETDNVQCGDRNQQKDSTGSSSKAGTSRHSSSYRRRNNRSHSSKGLVNVPHNRRQQWIKKESDPSEQ